MTSEEISTLTTQLLQLIAKAVELAQGVQSGELTKEEVRKRKTELHEDLKAAFAQGDTYLDDKFDKG